MNLTQHEVDLLIGKSWPEIVAVREELDKLDRRRDELDHLNSEYEAGEPVAVLLIDRHGIAYFKHRTTGPSELFERIVQECAGSLVKERIAIFDQHRTKVISEVIGDISVKPKGKQAITLKGMNQKLDSINNGDIVDLAKSKLADDAREWLTTEQVVDRAGIVKAYVSAWTKNKGFHRKRDGQRMLYGVPDGFQFNQLFLKGEGL
ncbi:hypothetical protein CLV58_12539 [Spirosoma oryzae]|uniref:Uncharacterized protein n=1 Tax=Spirosoma oryzae TaxID=1469603 RepID=A0A2T0S8L6_9BACT|nr:hypothetical protein [Spirosoma oryzae]PRY29777.1 hypothetical protein CLV58_12539 [Spirosoma oryzae]